MLNKQNNNTGFAFERFGKKYNSKNNEKKITKVRKCRKKYKSFKKVQNFLKRFGGPKKVQIF